SGDLHPPLCKVPEQLAELAEIKEELAKTKTQLDAAKTAGISKAESSVKRLELVLDQLRNRDELNNHQLQNALAGGAKLALTSMHDVLPLLSNTTNDLTLSFNTLSEAVNGLPLEGRNAILGRLRPFKDSAQRSLHNVFRSECNAEHLDRAQAYFLAMGPREMSKTPVDMEARSNDESVWRFKSSSDFQFIPSLDVDLCRIHLQRAIDKLGNTGFLDGAVWTPGMDKKEIESVERRALARDDASGLGH
ncbi:hypothetical protein V5O48_014894, partial [Marasmius crinis-equi]